jgi:hypothetical protein
VKKLRQHYYLNLYFGSFCKKISFPKKIASFLSFYDINTPSIKLRQRTLAIYCQHRTNILTIFVGQDNETHSKAVGVRAAASS